MPDYTHCPDCGEGIFRLATPSGSGQHLIVDGECSPLGDIAVIGNLAMVLKGDQLDAARDKHTPLHQRHRRSCAALDQRLIRFAKRHKGKKKAKHAAS